MPDDAQRIADCRELYIKYGGRRHEEIEREMRDRGHARFRRRIMYTRRERGRSRPGWIDRFGWRKRVRALKAETQPVGSVRSTAMRDPDVSTRSRVLNAPIESLPPRKYNHAKFRRKCKELHRRNAGIPACMNAVASRSSADGLFTVHLDGGTADAGTDARVPTRSPTDDFHAWLKTLPGIWNWDWRHQTYLYDHLKRVTDGTCKRLMIFMPPRHGKSELVTVRYTAWRLRQDPSLKVILAGYNQSLANNFSRKIKNVLCDDANLTSETQRRGEENEAKANLGRSHDPRPLDPNIPHGSSPRPGVSAVNPGSPFPFTQTRPKNSEAEWETTMGGGLRAVGVGGGITGFGAKLIVIDDPVKSRAEAESPKLREKVWNWFTDDIYTRLEPKGSIILIQTRWHEDDLAGRLLKEMEEGGEQWEVVSLPALAESEITNDQLRITNSDENPPAPDPDIRNSSFIIRNLHADPIGREPGEALCPERFDKPALENIERQLGTYSFSALYQQRPTPADGMIFKREWFANVVKQPPPGLKWTRGYDLAVSTKTTADYTASFRVAYDDEGNLYIDGGFRKRIEFPEQRRYILGRISAERDTEHGIELALHGQGIMQDLRREARLQGRRFRGIQVTGDKLTRALKWSALAEEGRVRLVRGPWNADFIDEACAFPGGQHDDQIDAVSLAVTMHERRGGRLVRF